ncbi:hypothetical protein BaRGS_00036805 [Batillaria attramentaria]|uniref:Uncharacterized protein n=1 Tax=Batillaria attramentaria TaxID=370345 RepID=A0ABD0JAY0_9CAEN
MTRRRKKWRCCQKDHGHTSDTLERVQRTAAGEGKKERRRKFNTMDYGLLTHWRLFNVAGSVSPEAPSSLCLLREVQCELARPAGK